MAILGWIFVGMLVVSAVGIAVIFGPLVFVDKISIVKMKLSREIVPLVEGVQVEEISDNEQPLPYERQPGTGDVAAAETMLLAEDGAIEAKRRIREGEALRQVHVLLREDGAQSLVFTGNDVYRFEHDRFGEYLGSLSGPALSNLNHVSVVTEDTLLLAGYLAEVRYAEVRLYQINLPDFHQQEIAADPYYLFDRPPKIFKPEGFNGVVVVYYTGSYDFAMGGDASRPKYSVIRIYNDQHPKGRDILKLGFKAGTVVNIAGQNGELILQADPSLPAMVNKPRAPARVWRVKL